MSGVGEDLERPVASMFDRVWTFLTEIATWKFLTIWAVVVVLRSGVAVHTLAPLIDFTRHFPHPPADYRANAVVGPTLTRMLGQRSRAVFVLVHGMATLVWFALVLGLLRKRIPSAAAWRASVVWVGVSATPMLALQSIGFYDVWTLLGGTLIALGENPLLAFAGGALLGATNAEQGLAVVVCFALVRFAPAARGDAPLSSAMPWWTAGPALLGLVAARGGVLAWFSSYGANANTRGSLYLSGFRLSIRYALDLGTLGVYSWLGLAWVLVVLFVRGVSRESRLTLVTGLMGLVVLPAIFTVTTLDGTRVFASVSWAALLTVVVVFARDFDGDLAATKRRIVAGVALASIILPSYQTTYSHSFPDVIGPWTQVASKLFR